MQRCPALPGGANGAFARRWSPPALLVAALVSCAVKGAAAEVPTSLRATGRPPAARGGAKLSLVQLGADAVALAEGKDSPLFEVRVPLDRKRLSAQRGVTIVMDRSSRSLQMQEGMEPPRGIAAARLTDSIATTGWSELVVKAESSGSRASNDVRMYAAGFAEGYLAAELTTQFYANLEALLARDTLWAATRGRMKAVFERNLEHLKDKSNFRGGPAGEEPTDPYWKHARYILSQLWGMKDGHNAAAASLGPGVPPIDLMDLLILNSHAELPELMEAHRPVLRRQGQRPRALLQRDSRAGRGPRTLSAVGGGSIAPSAAKGASNKTNDGLSDRDWERRMAKHGHCSALVRLTAGTEDLLVGHTTWSDYSKMTRIFKYYDLELPGSATAARLAAFSSYPGCISSTDDFYMLQSGLLVMDTSIEILDPKVYSMPARPPRAQLPTFVHVMAVNRMAKTGVHWTVLMAEQNSGTGSAQWLVVDYNRFSPGKPLGEDTLRLLEQVPGMTRQADLSRELATQGYWASYNRPYLEEVREKAGHTAAEAAHGALFSFKDSPRATLFRQFGPSISGIAGMRALMDRNDYPDEGVEPSEPGHTIAARLDLDPQDPIPNGAIDVKVTSFQLFSQSQCQAISGPSYEQQQPFEWTVSGEESFPGWPHEGLPNTYEFDWVQMTPSGLRPKVASGGPR